MIRAHPPGSGNLQVAVLLSLAAAGGGCGFLGEDPFGGKARSHTTAAAAPWSDLGPVVFCDGAARVGWPTQLRAALCIGGGGSARSCASDGECRSRERCTCGGCQVAFCTSGDECPSGSVCSFADQRCDRPCVVDGDCARGEVCVPGQEVCRGGCQSDADCQRGELCDGGSCVTRPCKSDTGCAAGASCVVQRVPGELREPSPAVSAPSRGAPPSSLVLWIERALAGQSAVWRATSTDGLRFRFDPPAPVLAPDAADGGRAGAPSLLRVPNGYLAVYANGRGRLRRATSSDGIAFSVDAAPVLAPVAAFEQSGLDSPSLAPSPRAGDVLLYYGTVDRSALGLAESSDDTHFAARASPVLTPQAVMDPVLWRELDRIASPFAEPALAPDGTYFLRLFFAARGRESGPAMEFGTAVAETPNFSIGEAATLDGMTLVPWPFNPVFDRVLGFLDHPAELDPAVVSVGARRFLYYRGAASDETRQTNLGVAENPPPIE